MVPSFLLRRVKLHCCSFIFPLFENSPLSDAVCSDVIISSIFPIMQKCSTGLFQTMISLSFSFFLCRRQPWRQHQLLSRPSVNITCLSAQLCRRSGKNRVMLSAARAEISSIFGKSVRLEDLWGEKAVEIKTFMNFGFFSCRLRLFPVAFSTPPCLSSHYPSFPQPIHHFHNTSRWTNSCSTGQRKIDLLVYRRKETVKEAGGCNWKGKGWKWKRLRCVHCTQVKETKWHSLTN